MFPRPGDLTRVLGDEPVTIYYDLPVDNVIGGKPCMHISAQADGLLFVLGVKSNWCFVLTSSQKMGWIYKYDVGPSHFAGAVYHIER